MSVQTGIAPQRLVELDGDMLDALVDALERRWTSELELAAQTLELMHAQFVAYLRAHTSKGTRMPPVLRVPRPGDAPAPAGPARVRVGEFAALVGRSHLVPVGEGA